MNILALDLADHTGWAARRTPFGFPVTHESGVQRHSDADDAGRDLCYRQGLRLSRFRGWLRRTLDTFAWGGPSSSAVAPGSLFVAYEAPIMFAGRPSGAIAAYQYEGVLLAELASLSIPHRSVATGTLKKHATGRGDAKKPEMIRAARLRWAGQLGPTSAETLATLLDDEADALCVLAWALDELGER